MIFLIIIDSFFKKEEVFVKKIEFFIEIIIEFAFDNNLNK